MKTFILFLAGLWGMGCAATLAPEQNAVRITTNPQETRSCKFMQEIEASAPKTLTLNGGKESVLEDLKIQAYRLGADLVYRSDFLLIENHWHVKGEVYQCTVKQMQAGK
jgi:hypothetical protein